MGKSVEANEMTQEKKAERERQEAMIQGVVQNMLLTGAVGATWGSVLAVYRGHSVPYYTLNMGATWGMIGAVFFSLQEVMERQFGL
eukprot:CAMPEP_0113938310 /NCGR_PEP_ID=MMETSP1339-20121228/4749_1 /TAXON_ID=94617 /ORGANISM="Fibrocapsa japonica" /LENGTH=85 /DNA_ID=CAMNT_0000941369 /DNA_START=117 /DNA_END=371 /DNA_ORIENTATION=- /assembly_acc=CAM_ASM_000762